MLAWALGTEARQASYGERSLQAIPPGLTERYFEPAGSRFTLRKDLRRHGSILTPVDPKRRIFRRVPRSLYQTGAVFAEALPAAANPVMGLDQLRNEAFAASPVAQLGLTSDGLVVLTNTRLDSLFGVSSRDIGRPFRDLDLSYRPVELRRYIEQAQVERRTLRVTDVEYLRGGEVIHLEIQLSPLIGSDGSRLGVDLVFNDVTAARRLQDDLEHAHQQLEAAYEELQNINDQLRVSTAQLDDANAFMETVLASLRAGVVVVDGDMRIRVWNQRAEDLWGLRSHEVVGQHFLNLDIGLPFEQLRPLLRGVLAAQGNPAEVALEAVNRRGRAITVRVAATPLAARIRLRTTTGPSL